VLLLIVIRIVGGAYKNRAIPLKKNKKNFVRPTLVRARRIIFDTITSYLAKYDVPTSDVVFVDTFAGSGAMGIEALSRGMRSVFFELDFVIFKALKTYLSSLKNVPSYETYRINALRPPWNKGTFNKETSNKEALNKETLNKETLNKETLNKETSNKETLNKETLNKETSNKETLNKETLNKETLNKETLNKETLNKGGFPNIIFLDAPFKNSDIVPDVVKRMEKYGWVRKNTETELGTLIIVETHKAKNFDIAGFQPWKERVVGQTIIRFFSSI
jgi:16S rRNA G966 N2-methylase RsmD